MKRLALVLAAISLAGTGCIVHDSHDRNPPPAACTTQAVTLDWSGGFQDYTGATLDCAGAQVSGVDVWVNGNFDSTYACTGGSARAVALPIGTNAFTVEGIEAGTGRIAFRAEASVSGAACSDQRVTVKPAEGLLVVDYSFSPDNACYGAAPTYIWASVRDDVAGQVAFVDKSTTFACSLTTAAPAYLLPVGSFTLLGVEEAQIISSSSAALRAVSCTGQPFVIAGGMTTTLASVLDDTLDSYPACF
jgi:hypothetical protein